MAKTYLNQAKYIIKQSFEIKGVVDKHDIIGAIFGQSEGLIGEDLDIRELQSSGKIGRIELELASERGVTKGTLIIPSGADMVETAILASTIEVVDKVGPCDAFFKTDAIEDTRGSKRKRIVERAKELLGTILSEEIPDSTEITNEVREDIQTSRVVLYGPDKLSAGPIIDESEEIILVEGRADVLNLLKYNIKNVIAMGGSKIPPTVIDLCKRKTVTAFMDGDRGGALDLKKLLQIAEIDFIAKAPPGLEVEELAKKQILAALNKRIPVAQTKSQEELDVPEEYWKVDNKDLFAELDIEVHEKNDSKVESKFEQKIEHKSERVEEKREYPKYEHKPFDKRNNFRNDYRNRYDQRKDFMKKPEEKPIEKLPVNVTPIISEKPKIEQKIEQKVEVKKDDTFKEFPLDVKKNMEDLKGSFSARFFDSTGKLISDSKVKDVLKAIKGIKNAKYLLFDGIITKRLVEMSKGKGIDSIVGSRIGKMDKIKGIEVHEYDA